LCIFLYDNHLTGIFKIQHITMLQTVSKQTHFSTVLNEITTREQAVERTTRAVRNVAHCPSVLVTCSWDKTLHYSNWRPIWLFFFYIIFFQYFRQCSFMWKSKLWLNSYQLHAGPSQYETHWTPSFRHNKKDGSSKQKNLLIYTALNGMHRCMKNILISNSIIIL
jgi:hypothetical protein